MKIQVKTRRCDLCNTIVSEAGKMIDKMAIPDLESRDTIETSLSDKQAVRLCDDCFQSLRDKGIPVLMVRGKEPLWAVYYQGFLYWPYRHKGKSFPISKVVFVPPKRVILFQDEHGKRYAISPSDPPDNDILRMIPPLESWNIIIEINNKANYVPEIYYRIYTDDFGIDLPEPKPLPDIYKRILDFISNAVCQEV